jgi:transposase
MVQLAKQLVDKAKTVNDLRAGLTVMIPKFCNASNAQTAELLGIGVATVVRMKKQIRDQAAGKKAPKQQWGGRRRQNLAIEQEKEFLAYWVDKAAEGGVLVVPPLHEALEKRLGRKVAASSVYRMLARHGWRKVEPDTCHPKRDPDAQAEFKKNSAKQWRKLSKKML